MECRLLEHSLDELLSPAVSGFDDKYDSHEFLFDRRRGPRFC